MVAKLGFGNRWPLVEPWVPHLLAVTLKGWDYFLPLDLGFLVSRIWIIVYTSWGYYRDEGTDVSKVMRISPSSSSPLLSRVCSLLCHTKEPKQRAVFPQNKSRVHGILSKNLLCYVPLMFPGNIGIWFQYLRNAVVKRRLGSCSFSCWLCDPQQATLPPWASVSLFVK